MNPIRLIDRLALGALLVFALGAPFEAGAQIAFRAAASSTAIAPQFRAATSATLTTPAFRAATSAAVIAGNLVITKPAGLALNDIMIASVGIRPVAATIAPPAGWTLIRRQDNAAPNANSLAVYWKLANAADVAAANFTFTLGGGFTHSSGGIQAFSGVDTRTPFDVEVGANTASALTHAIPAITPTVANSMIVGSVSFASASSFTPGGTYTESFDVCAQSPLAPCPADNTVGQTTEGVRLLQVARAAVAAANSTAASSADVGNTHVVALKPVLRVNAPAGIVTNDMMIAAVAVQPSTAAVTPPAGWTLIRRTNNAAAQSNSLLVYWKFAAAADTVAGTFYEWTVGSAATVADFAVGGIQAFLNVDTVNPVASPGVDVENGQTTASSLNHATPSVGTAGNNEMVVTFHTFASSSSFTPPAGMAEDFDQANGAAAAAGQTIEGNHAIQVAAGATGVKTGVALANADAGNTQILALQSPRPDLVIPVPAGTFVNDVMIAAVAVTPSSATVTAPAGWTLVRSINNANPTTNSLYTYQRTATAAEPASYTWTFVTAANPFLDAAGGIQSFSGVNTASPINIGNIQNTVSGLAHATPSVITTVTNTMLVTNHAYASSATFAPPGGMTEAYDTASRTVPDPAGISIEGNYAPQAVAGATGAKTATGSGNADVGNADIEALQGFATPTGFNAFETSTLPATAITGKIFTKLVGTAFSLDLVAILGAAQHTGFTNPVLVELVANTTGSALGGNNCPTVLTLVQTVAPNPPIVAGRSTVAFTAVATAYRDVRVRISYPAAAPSVIVCSTDNFAIRPTAISSVTSNMTNALSTGTPLQRAGSGTFTITAVAGAGYDGTPAINNALLTAHAGAIAIGSVSGTFPAATIGTGSSAGASFVYSEVGNFTIGINGVADSTFTAVDAGGPDCVVGGFSNILAGGQYGCNFGNTSASAAIGRFRPDRFVLVAGSTLTNRSSSACAPASMFTYMDEPFAVAFSLQAMNGAGTPALTQNYNGVTWGKLNPLSWANLGVGALSAATNLGARLDTSIAPAGSFTSGVAAVTGTLALRRATPDNPDGPYAAAKIGIVPDDLDAIAGLGTRLLPAALDMDVDGVGGNDHQQIGPNTEFRFGRLRLQNATGSDKVSLKVPVQTQYWNGSGFATNTLDSCTALPQSSIALSGETGGLVPSPNCRTFVEQTPNVTFASGVGTLSLSKTAANATGNLLLTARLGAAGAPPNYCTGTASAPTAASNAAMSYLLGRWDDSSNPDANANTNYDDNPAARIGFGVYGGQPRNFIFYRENY